MIERIDRSRSPESALPEHEREVAQLTPGGMALGGQQGQGGWSGVSHGIMAGPIVQPIP